MLCKLGNRRKAMKLELKPFCEFLQLFTVEITYLEVLLDEFAFLADEGSTRYGSEVYHRLKLLPLILCYATICSESSNVNNAVAIVSIFLYNTIIWCYTRNGLAILLDLLSILI